MRGWWRRTAAAAALGVILASLLGAGVAEAHPASPPDVRAVVKLHTAAQAVAARATGAPSATDTLNTLADVTGGPIAAGGSHSCATALLGDVWCWGANGSGQLGDGSTDDSAEPVRAMSAEEGDAPVVALSVVAGRAHTCALAVKFEDFDTGVFCWGDNADGQLGDGATADRLEPVEVATGAVQVAAGADHTCMLTEDQTVACWGRNDVGQLGIGAAGGSELNPQEVPGLDDVAHVAANDNNTCAVDDDGAAWCWGSDTHGQLGDGGGSSGTPQPSPAPVAVTGVNGDFLQIAVGRRHVCALTTREAIYCWGDDAAGQLGNGGSAADPSRPAVVAAGGRHFYTVAAGGDSSCGVSVNGAAYCWGENGDGQLGVGDTTNRSAPAEVAQGDVVASPLTKLIYDVNLPMLSGVALGGTHSCGVDVVGAPYCWGDNSAGQLGDGSSDGSTTPVQTMLTPSPPSAVHATGRKAALRVGWTAPADAGVAPVENYAAVAIQGADGVNGAVCETTGALACTVAGLVDNTRYSVLVAVLTGAGVAYSDAIQASTLAAGGTGGGAELPITGRNVSAQLAFAGMLLAAGSTCLLSATRRRTFGGVA